MKFSNINQSGLTLDIHAQTLTIDLTNTNTRNKLSAMFNQMKKDGETDAIQFFLQMMTNREDVINVSEQLNTTIQAEVDALKTENPHWFDEDGNIDLAIVAGIKEVVSH